jgi:hypothetical protein
MTPTGSTQHALARVAATAAGPCHRSTRLFTVAQIVESDTYDDRSAELDSPKSRCPGAQLRESEVEAVATGYAGGHDVHRGVEMSRTATIQVGYVNERAAAVPVVVIASGGITRPPRQMPLRSRGLGLPRSGEHRPVAN